MQNRKTLLIIMPILLVISALLIYEFRPVTLFIRPLIIKIIDQNNGDPIEGIKIFYDLQIGTFSSPVINWHNGEVQVYENNVYISDQNGDVYIKSKSIRFRKNKNAYIDKEKLLVNCEAENPETYPFNAILSRKPLINNNKNYMGKLVYLLPSEGFSEGYKIVRENILNTDVYENSFKKDIEEILVFLERKKMDGSE